MTRSSSKPVEWIIVWTWVSTFPKERVPLWFSIEADTKVVAAGQTWASLQEMPMTYGAPMSKAPVWVDGWDQWRGPKGQ